MKVSKYTIIREARLPGGDCPGDRKNSKKKTDKGLRVFVDSR